MSAGGVISVKTKPGQVKYPAKIAVVGERQLRRKLKETEGGIADLKAVHKDSAEIVASAARPLVPVLTGRLEGSIRAMATMRAGVVKAGGAVVPYAGPIHFGWPSRPDPAKKWRGGPIDPQPFLYEAMDARRGEVVRAYKEHVDSVIKKYDLN